MKKFASIALGIVTSVAGYLEAGSLATALQAGARFRFGLLWPVALGTICIAFLTEMTGRLAAVSHHTVVAAMRERFGASFHVWPFAAQIVVDLLVLASEVGGASIALELATGVSMRVWVVPITVAIWACLWFATFGTIEHSVAILGLVTLCFVVAAVRLHPAWLGVARGLLPHIPRAERPQYAYLAVGILGATISPYLATFYSSGAVEEQWTTGYLMPNRIVASVGMTFGGAVSAAVIVVAALILAPAGAKVETFGDAANVLVPVFGRWGRPLFCASLAIGCLGAALELALDLSYIVSQTFGWNWGESQRPADEARFAAVYTAALAVAVVPSLVGIDPLKLTMFSMAITALALPVVFGPFVVLMNDRAYLKRHTNGPIGNIAVVAIVALSFALAAAAIPLQLAGS